MERLTVNDLNKICYDPWELCGMDSHCTKGCHEDGGCTKGCHILKMYRKLAEYEDLEEQGRLLKLPCAVGDTVYTLNPLPSGKTVIAETTTDAFFCALCVLEDRINKTVFLTESEAELALQKMNEMEGEE